MSRLEELLSSPSPESWREIVELGKAALKESRRSAPDCNHMPWHVFSELLVAAIKNWPPEIERLCPESWPSVFREAVEHRVIETDTYEHYVAKICGDPRLRLSDGKTQAVWLERRFTGGIVPVSTAQIALRSISAALASIASSHGAPSIASAARFIEAARRAIESARNVLSNGVRRVGKVGCADLTGGVIIEMRDGPNFDVRLEVEIKVGNQEQEPAQVIRMNSVRSRGGCYVLARSVEEAVLAIIAFRNAH